MPTSGVVVDRFSRDFGPPPSSSSSRQCRDISNLPGSQGSLSKVDSNTLMIRKVQKEHVPETENDCKTRSNFRALFYRVSRAFGCDQNVHVALVTRGARRSTRNLPYVTITHSYVLAFFATMHRFLSLFRSHFCRNCSFTRRYQHDSVLEPFPHFGRRTNSLGSPRAAFFFLRPACCRASHNIRRPRRPCGHLASARSGQLATVVHNGESHRHRNCS